MTLRRRRRRAVSLSSFHSDPLLHFVKPGVQWNKAKVKLKANKAVVWLVWSHVILMTLDILTEGRK